MRGKDVYRLSFVAADERSPPLANRVRKLLKFALRSVGLICVSVDGGESGAVPNLEMADYAEALKRMQERVANPPEGEA